jgi:hypothetical protein
MPVFGGLFDHHRYREAFLLAAAFPVAGSLAWQALNITGKPLARRGGL